MGSRVGTTTCLGSSLGRSHAPHLPHPTARESHAMSDVVRIELDRSSRIYRSGEDISGAIIVDESVARRARRIVLRTWWETSGRGTAVKGGKRMAVLHEGAPRNKGSASEYRFRFDTPEGPFTYRGHLLAVEHIVQAVVELPDDDEEARGVFELLPGEAVAVAPEAALTPGDASIRSRRTRGVLLFGTIFVGVGVISLPLPGLPFVVVGATLIGVGLRREIAASKTGEVFVRIEPPVAAPGDTVDVHVRINPPRPLPVQGVTVYLQARELCMSGGSDNRKNHRYVLHLDEKEALGETTLAGELNNELSASFMIPRLDAWTFQTMDNEVRWEAGARVRLPRWPDWSGETPLVVWPRTQVAAPPSGKALPEEAARPPAAAEARDQGAPPEAAPPPSAATAPDAADGIHAHGAAAEPEAPVGIPARGAAAGSATTDQAAPAPVTPPSTRPRREAGRLATERPARRGGARSASADPRVAPAPAPFRASGASTDPFVGTVEEILALRRYGSGRDALIEGMIDSSVTVDVVVERIDRPFGRTRTPGYEGGAVVRGRLGDEGPAVEILVPTDRRELIDGVARGDLLTASGVVASWQRLPERPVIRVPVPPVAEGADNEGG